MHSEAAIERVEAAIEAIKRGEMVILVDNEDRENEGDLVMAADRVTPEAINFMATHARGLICLSLTRERIDHLQIPMMVTSNDSPYGTAFTVSIEAREGVSTGISAADRARTVQAAVDPASGPADLIMPGHIFPLRARDGGVLTRTGQTEGSVDLARLAGLTPAGVICEVMNPDGTMARMPELRAFAETHGLVLLSVADLITFRLQRDSLIELVEEAELETEYPGQWRARVYRSVLDGSTHLCFVCGQPDPETPSLVRVQHRADTFEVFTHRHSPALATLQGSMQAIGEAGVGAIVYIDKAPRSALDLLHKHTTSAAREDRPEATRAERIAEVNRPQPELRDLGMGAQILVDVGVGQMRLLTNRPKQLVGLEGYGLTVIDQVAIPTPR